MGKVFTSGLMVVSMMASTKMIRNVAEELSTGRMGGSITEAGRMADNMGRLSSLQRQVNRGGGSGTKARE